MNQQQKTAKEQILEMFKHKEVMVRIYERSESIQFPGNLMQESDAMWLVSTGEFEIHISVLGTYTLQVGETLIIILEA